MSVGAAREVRCVLRAQLLWVQVGGELVKILCLVQHTMEMCMAFPSAKVLVMLSVFKALPLSFSCFPFSPIDTLLRPPPRFSFLPSMCACGRWMLAMPPWGERSQGKKELGVHFHSIMLMADWCGKGLT